jgi:hypothetical protein
MSDIDLHIFKEDLAAVPPKGSSAPPVSIRARDLDGNFAKVTVLPSEVDPPEYEVEYKEDGVLLSKFLPEGEALGNVLYWDGNKWETTATPEGNGELLYWDGEQWVALPPSAGDEKPHYLQYDGADLFWGEVDALPEGDQTGNILYWDGTKWEPAASPQTGGDILFWNGEAWQSLAAPQDSTLRVLTIQNGSLTWLATVDCDTE